MSGRIPKRAGIIIFSKDLTQVCLVLASNGVWSFPKGVKEKKETLQQCAIRETMEETGLEITIKSKPYVTELTSANRPTVRYFIKILESSQLPGHGSGDGSEITSVEFMPVKQAKELLPERRKKAFEDALKKLYIE